MKDPRLPDLADPYVRTVSDAIVDKKVSNLMMLGSNQWDIDLIKDVFSDRDASLILSISVAANGENDIWYWRQERLGHYSVKSAYRLLQEGKEEAVGVDVSKYWKTLLNLKVPPKVKNFLWRASTNCLPTKVQLCTKQVNINAMCPLCNVERESIIHVLVNCSFEQHCWEKLGIEENYDYTGTFSGWLGAKFEKWSQEGRQQIALVSWAIWRVRNELVWHQKGTDVADLVVLARTILNQWKCAQDKSFDTSLCLLKTEDGDEHWTAPKDQMIKVNTDAAIFDSANCFSFSLVARDSNVLLKEARAVCKRGVIQPELAEAIGVREALSWIKDHDGERL